MSPTPPRSRGQLRHATATLAASGPAFFVAIASSAAALGVSLAVGGSDSAVAPVLFLGAVAVTAWMGGLVPGLLATMLGFLALDFFFEDQAYSLAVSSPGTLLDSVAYLGIAVLLGSLNAQLRRARARAEASLAETKAALHARDEALAAVSHDLRTPLTAIRTAAAALDDASPDLDIGARRRLLDTITSESERLEHFIADALALGRLEAGVQANPTLNAPGEVVSAILDRHMPLLDGRKVSFDVPDTLPLIWFDATLLEQVVGNLLDNVAVHTPSGTELSIVGRIESQGQFRLEVADAGPGIAPADRERVFRKFERLHDDGPGAGLGLSVARAAAQAQGGDLRVEASSLGGAAFVLTLPGVRDREPRTTE